MVNGKTPRYVGKLTNMLVYDKLFVFATPLAC